MSHIWRVGQQVYYRGSTTVETYTILELSYGLNNNLVKIQANTTGQMHIVALVELTPVRNVLGLPCPACNAKKGFRCELAWRTDEGWPIYVNWFHNARMDLAKPRKEIPPSEQPE